MNISEMEGVIHEIEDLRSKNLDTSSPFQFGYKTAMDDVLEIINGYRHPTASETPTEVPEKTRPLGLSDK